MGCHQLLVQDKRDKLIAIQQLEIQILKEKVAEYEKARNTILGIIYGCGGPLNDNCKQYTSSQMKDFWDIKNLIEIEEVLYDD